MHNAPVVSFRVQRSHFQGWFLAIALTAGALVSGWWLAQHDVTGWRLYIALAAWGTCGLLVLQALRRGSADGHLHWDGIAWHHETAGRSIAGRLAVHVDLQFFMLLSLRTDAGKVSWFWLDRPAVRASWDALRRAIWSPQGRSDPADDARAWPVQGGGA